MVKHLASLGVPVLAAVGVAWSAGPPESGSTSAEVIAAGAAPLPGLDPALFKMRGAGPAHRPVGRCH